MRRLGGLPSAFGLGRAWIFASLIGVVLAPRDASAQIWAGYGSDPQHTCLSAVASQLPQKVLWSMPVDTSVPPTGDIGDIYVHYASPIITRKNSVIVTVRTATGFQLTAVRGQDGSAIWPKPLVTDYILPQHNWTPVCGSTLVSGGLSLAVPGPGGTVYIRTNPDRGAGVVTQIPFYTSLATYQASKASYNASIFICTPITADSQGNLYFGFSVEASNSDPKAPKAGGLARISPSTGAGSFITAADLTNDSSMRKAVFNCAPALSNDGSTVYIAVNGAVDGSDGIGGAGYLVSVNSQTLAKSSAKARRLQDPRTLTDAQVPDDGSGTPTVGPDGDVYFGVLEQSIPAVNDDRGWLLHFSGDLSVAKTPGSFGWDDTASIVPASAVKSYTGTSSYLVLTKYNNYADFGATYGDGMNRMAILDPNASESYSTPAIPGQKTIQVMKEVITVLGPTKNTELPLGVREWCVNSVAVDPINRCAVVNSEDGHVYRWNFDTNTLTPQLALAEATGEAYTPTVIGPDGAVYAINRAVLNCCVKAP